jgi:sarcosine oxidase subunit alpha
VIEAIGRDCVEGAVVKNLETGDTRKFSVDLICIAVGLSPSIQILKQAGCRSAYIPELGGEVVLHDEDYRTGVKDIFVAGDSAAVEEASSAMIGGRIAAISALLELEDNVRADERRRELR